MVSATTEMKQPPLIASEPLKMKWASVKTASIPIPPHGTGPDVDLVENIRANGIMEPLIVREEAGPNGAKAYRLLEGRRRLISANRIELERVPVLIAIGDVSDDAMRLAIHGLRRSNPVMECQAIESLVREGHSESEIAKATGFSTATVQERQLYLRLLPELKDAFYDGKISAAVAKAASALTVSQQNRCLELFDKNGKLTAKDVRAQKTIESGSTDLLDGFESPDDDGAGKLPDAVIAVLKDAIGRLRSGVIDLDAQIEISEMLEELLPD